VGDVRSFIRVLGLRGCGECGVDEEFGDGGWVNAEGVKLAVERVVSFRVRFVVEGGDDRELWNDVWEEVWGSVKAPF